MAVFGGLLRKNEHDHQSLSSGGRNSTRRCPAICEVVRLNRQTTNKQRIQGYFTFTMMESDTLPEEIPYVSTPAREQLSERQVVDYRGFKSKLLEWLYHVGKDPEYAEGYAKETVRQVSYKTDKFYRWLWEKRGRYTTELAPSDADEYMKELVYSDKDYSTGYKASTQKCLKRVFKWHRFERGREVEWDPTHTFSQNPSQPRDFLNIDERQRIREAALEYGTVPNYDGLTSEERNKWRAHLAQRFGKPKEEVSPADWERANGWKVPSMVWVSLDCGLRPVEVGRARVEWVDVDNLTLRIPQGRVIQEHG